MNMNNVIGHKTAINFLMDVLENLSVSLQTAINSGNFFLDPTDLYVKANIAGASGYHRVLDGNSKKLPGICSFDTDGRLEQNRAAVWNRIVVRYGVADAGTGPGAVNYNTAIPVTLENAELVIVQKGREVLRKSVRSLFAKANENQTGADHLDLASLRLFVDEEDVEIGLDFPKDGAAMPAAGAGTTPFIYISIDALVTRKR